MADQRLEYWPSNFDEKARAFLFESAKRRVTEMTAVVAQQESKSATLFAASIVMAGAGGWAGHLRLGFQIVPLGTLAALLATLVAFYCAYRVFRVRDYETGENVRSLSKESGDPMEDLRDAALEVLVDAFDDLKAASDEKGPWLARQMYAAIAQAVTVFLVLATR